MWMLTLKFGSSMKIDKESVSVKKVVIKGTRDFLHRTAVPDLAMN